MNKGTHFLRSLPVFLHTSRASSCSRPGQEVPGLGWGWGSLDGRQGLWTALLSYFSNFLLPEGRIFLESWDTSIHIHIHSSSTTLDLEKMLCAFGLTWAHHKDLEQGPDTNLTINMYNLKKLVLL